MRPVSFLPDIYVDDVSFQGHVRLDIYSGSVTSSFSFKLCDRARSLTLDVQLAQISVVGHDDDAKFLKRRFDSKLGIRLGLRR